MRQRWAPGALLVCLVLTSCGNASPVNSVSDNAAAAVTVIHPANPVDSNTAVSLNSSDPAPVSTQNSTPVNAAPSPPPTPSHETTSHPPVPKEKVIVIDAGHGGADSGAIGIHGVMEKNLTLSYAFAVQNALEARGYKVFLTRSSDTAVNPNTTDVEQEIRSRTALSKRNNASVYVSIHMNWYSNSSANGTETFYNDTNHREGLENPYPEQSILLAKTLEQHITDAIHTANRGSQDDELYNLITNTVPASLVEVGFISNQSDLDKILNPKVKTAFARAFADAMDAYFEKLK